MIAALLVSCGARQGTEPESALDVLRREADDSDDGELLAGWLLEELMAPGGDVKRAQTARKQLDAAKARGMLAHLARALDDSLHGRMLRVSDEFLLAARAARTSSDARAPYVGWFAIRQALVHRSATPELWKRSKQFIEEAMRDPRQLGWRARSELVEWWSEEAYAEAAGDVEQLAAHHFGCAAHLRLAGPFGRGVARDALQSFAAERPGPWPAHFPAEPGLTQAPRILEIEQKGCMARVEEPTNDGIFYAETYIELPEERELLLAAQGALAIWVDDRQVLSRDPREWGVWPRFGAQLRLGAGRHRVLVKLADRLTSLRIMHPDGRPLHLRSSSDASAAYTLAPPRISGEPNLISRHIKHGTVIDPRDTVLRYIGAYLANVEGQGDVASVWLDALIGNTERATGPSLLLAATLLDNDPLFDQTAVRDLSRDLYERAVRKDGKLWQGRLALALWEAERAGASTAVRTLRALSQEFAGVPAVLSALSRLYGELGYSAEHAQAVKELARRFPDDVPALASAVKVYEAEGNHRGADALAARIRKLDPDSEIQFSRALEREDYATALAELRRLAKRHPDREDLEERIHDVLVRAGNEGETFKKLRAALGNQPRDERARLALADAEYARGDLSALRRAVASAVEAGSTTDQIRDALELVDGVSELEAYRIDAHAAIRAYEKAGKHLPGTAARVLDYAAVWVRSDGTSRMLEHEIVRLQSAEAISQMAERRRPEGLILHMRVIKKDGRILEPELVAKKPTVTFPHLEVGDYMETEHISRQSASPMAQDLYSGPHWFFREENVAYARSEFVVIAPKDKPLQIETRGNVPAPQVTEHGNVIVRRYRVDDSPAAPNEPGSAPAQEFLPSVRIGWGISLESRMRALADTVAEVGPTDPRIVRIAERIALPLPRAKKAERARRLYRWVLGNIEEGEESDGRRVVTAKRGNRWRAFMTLCRAVGIQASYAVAKSRLAPPPTGPLSRASLFSEPLLRVDTETGPLWLTLNSKYAPFGYVPAEVRAMPAYLLGGAAPELVQTPTQGAPDSIVYEGTGKLAADGSARLNLVQRYYGKYATSLRGGLAEVPERQVRDLLESKLLAPSLRGARLITHKVEALEQLDAPLTLRMTVDVPSLAQQSGGGLLLEPPYAPRLSQLATLPVRQTPLLLGDATHQEVRLSLELPPQAKVAKPQARVVHDGERQVRIRDRLEGSTLVLERVIAFPAGRIQPAEYAGFARFVRSAENALSTSIRISLR
jgi:tetratricopeptide (TPR) repeat protein